MRLPIYPPARRRLIVFACSRRVYRVRRRGFSPQRVLEPSSSQVAQPREAPFRSVGALAILPPPGVPARVVWPRSLDPVDTRARSLDA